MTQSQGFNRLAGSAVAVLLSAVLILFSPQCLPAAKAAGGAAGSLQQQQQSAEARRDALKDRISDIRRDIDRKEALMNEASADLKKSEKAISESNRTLKELREKRTKTENTLADLRREADLVGGHVRDTEETVSIISQAQFANSRRRPWQAVLAGGNPNEAARLSAILGYMAREQARTIDRLENRQKKIEEVAKKTRAARSELSRIESDEQKNRRQLQREKRSREAAVTKLKKQISSQKDRYEQLVKNDRELSLLIDDIDRRIAAAAEQERKRQAAEERLAKEASARAKAEGSKKKQEPSQTAGSGKSKSRTQAAEQPAGTGLAAQKGKLAMPTKGRIVARFGQKREGATSKLSWRGLLIRAKQGENVVATAQGTVVFSDWMRGFGNLLIIDHGSNYLSVYANNESLYKSVGDRVRRGETVAGVGSSGGEDEPGLYFELRYKGKPFDPSGWLAR